MKKALAFIAVAALLPAATGLEPLPIALPKPMFEGTPQNLRAPNLEPPRQGPRPPFLAPAGTVNLARGKRVTCSCGDPASGELSLATDGEKSGVDGTVVELPAGVQYITIDLKKKSAIYAVLFWHYHKQPRIFRSVAVQISDDPDFVGAVETIFNNDYDNSAGLGIGKDRNYIDTAEGKLVDAKGVEGRYVRLYSNGSTANPLNDYLEVEVYGKPLP